MKKWLGRIFGRSDSELVPYYDFENQRRIRIPRSELSPGSVLIQIRGESEPVYADSAALKLGDYQHETLPPELMNAITGIAGELSDVRPMTEEEWVDGFRRDANPEREVAGWQHLSRILRIVSDRHGYGIEQRREGFRILVACFTGPRDTVRNRSDPNLLPDDQIDCLIRYFFEGGY